MRKLMWFVVGVVLVAVVAVAVVSLAGGRWLQSGVESNGSEALGSELEVESASLSLLRAQVGLDGVKLANPEGFETPRAAEIPRTEADAQLLTLLSDPIKVDRIEVEEPVFTLEVGRTGTNLGTLLDHVESYQADAPDEEAPGPDVEVGVVRVTSPRVVLAQSVVGSPDGRELQLDTIELRDVGTTEEGRDRTIAAVYREVLEAVLEEIARHPELPEDLLPELEVEVEQLREKGQDLREGVEEQGEKLREGAQDALEGIRGGAQD